ncbi:hypothetical protein [Svornostia abyssi]|uniref:hypothetical protein n=1 Tax=Svornostia abyssi TaxID=2898438 RepID=UPI00338FD997
MQRGTSSVARDRVRAVDVTSRVMHRLLGLAVVTIGTGRNDAGRDGELRLDGLTVAETARLRAELLHRDTAEPTPDEGATAPGGRAARALAQLVGALRPVLLLRVRHARRPRGRRRADRRRGRERQPRDGRRRRRGHARRHPGDPAARAPRRGPGARGHPAVDGRLPRRALALHADARADRHAARHPRAADDPRDDARGAAPARGRTRRAAAAAPRARGARRGDRHRRRRARGIDTAAPGAP